MTARVDRTKACRPYYSLIISSDEVEASGPCFFSDVVVIYAMSWKLPLVHDLSSSNLQLLSDADG